MYKKTDPQMSFIDDFYIPFGGFLRSDNRWVILARNIPWEAIEAKYASLFSDVGQTCQADPHGRGILNHQRKNAILR